LDENNKSRDGSLVEGLVLGSLVSETLPADSAAALVYTTFPDRETAIAVARVLVEGRHAGCVNILEAMTSVYVWNGETVVGDEVVLIAKAPPEAVMGCIGELKRLLPYAVPAILVLPVAVGDAEYLDWLRAGTGPVS
jgi:periplasmic divalent cation tolerance protein